MKIMENMKLFVGKVFEKRRSFIAKYIYGEKARIGDHPHRHRK